MVTLTCFRSQLYHLKACVTLGLSLSFLMSKLERTSPLCAENKATQKAEHTLPASSWHLINAHSFLLEKSDFIFKKSTI